MSDVNDAIVAWRRQLEQQGGITTDDVTELESHLMEEMEALQKSGLRPEEVFMIASRRLGHPHELAAEYSKNDALMSWRRPARLALWGALLLEVMHLCWSVMCSGLSYLGAWISIGLPGQVNGFWIPHVVCWGALFLFWWLAENSHGWIARGWSRLEAAVQTGRGAILLILATTTLVIIRVVLMLAGLWLHSRGQMPPVATMFGQQDFFSVSMMALLTAGELTTSIPLVVLLIIFIHAEERSPLVRFATGPSNQTAQS